eukprot:NODE_15343_length_1055_cov_3.781250.p2 GENE.NODE_15343_length_1055_cov_3.781250~~NODE_15343_length_1055_cov_3.781250.p2  ORF type:complete len:163 (-),score=49.64 NODE_15343_length_1055_cov_3.781250:390-878(-)
MLSVREGEETDDLGISVLPDGCTVSGVDGFVGGEIIGDAAAVWKVTINEGVVEVGQVVIGITIVEVDMPSQTRERRAQLNRRGWHDLDFDNGAVMLLRLSHAIEGTARTLELRHLTGGTTHELMDIKSGDWRVYVALKNQGCFVPHVTLSTATMEEASQFAS